jgi:hypothetical protein
MRRIRATVKKSRVGQVRNRGFPVPCNAFFMLAPSFGYMHVQRPLQPAVCDSKFTAEPGIRQILRMDADIRNNPRDGTGIPTAREVDALTKSTFDEI